MGAAEYRGHPSPVLKLRLDHAVTLYERRLAPYIMTTGGPGGDASFTEGGVGRSYLIDRGVPAESIIVEDEGESTAYSLSAASEILRRMGLHSCIIVSDGYHVFRVKRILQRRRVLPPGRISAGAGRHDDTEGMVAVFPSGNCLWAVAHAAVRGFERHLIFTVTGLA